MNVIQQNRSIAAIRFVKIPKEVTSAHVKRDSNWAEMVTIVKVIAISLNWLNFHLYCLVSHAISRFTLRSAVKQEKYN